MTALWPSEHTVDLPRPVEVAGRSVHQVELRPPTGRDEAAALERLHLAAAHATTTLLACCVARVGDLPGDENVLRDLPVGIRDYLVLKVRQFLLGDRVAAVLTCPACGRRVDAGFRVSDIPVEAGAIQGSIHHLRLEGDLVARFRLPTGRDQEAVVGLDTEQAAEALLGCCLLEPAASDLSAAQRSRLVEEMDRVVPKTDLELTPTCPECGHEFVVPFDTTAFFLQELRRGGRDLLHEVHHIALRYHWSEADILALPRTRRRAYLFLLADSTREP
jgi:hypothetical protein